VLALMVLSEQQVVGCGDGTLWKMAGDGRWELALQPELGLEGCRAAPGMEPEGLHAFPGYPPGVSHTSDVSEPATAQRDICMAGTVFQEVCGHGNWRWIWTPCDKWTCDICRQTKLFGELVPEIVKALAEARRQRFTLKLLTLTWQGQTLGAQPTPEGATRRGLDQQHLVQWLKRQGYLPKGEVYYLRVAETHRSGKVHLHLYMVLRFVPHALLKEAWRIITGGSYIIDLQAVYLKCPHCWVKGQTRTEKKRRSIVPWPSPRGKCSDCGYVIHDAGQLARGIAVEAGKYLAKDGTEGVKKKLTRSGSTCRYCPDCDVPLVHPFLEWRPRRFVSFPMADIRYSERFEGWRVLREYLGPAVDIRLVRDVNVWRCPDCGCVVDCPVVRATGWARFRYEVEQEQGGQAGKSFCDDCEDEHAYTYVGTQLELLRDYPGLETVIGFNGGRGMGWVPVGGAPCLCWGQDLAWMRSRFTAGHGLGDLVHARDGPGGDDGWA